MTDINLSPEEAASVFKWRLKKIKQYKQQITRKRWRPAEKAMAASEYVREEAAILLALELLKDKSEEARLEKLDAEVCRKADIC